MENTFPNVLLLFFLVKDCFPALIYIICVFATEVSFATIISLYVSCLSLQSLII